MQKAGFNAQRASLNPTTPQFPWSTLFRACSATSLRRSRLTKRAREYRCPATIRASTRPDAHASGTAAASDQTQQQPGVVIISTDMPQRPLSCIPTPGKDAEFAEDAPGAGKRAPPVWPCTCSPGPPSSSATQADRPIRCCEHRGVYAQREGPWTLTVDVSNS